jgi:hypothetical protein
MPDFEALHHQAEVIRASGLLGQSRLLRLFDFLVEHSTAENAPKEAVIALDVFGKASTFDVSQDSSVRVYVHNLRRKLERFYEGPGASESVRLSIPKGEYRLTVVRRSDNSGDPSFRPSVRSVFKWPLLASAALGAAVAVLVAYAFWGMSRPPLDDWQGVRTNPIWRRLLEGDKPIVIVVGDYYIFGDTEQSSDVKRLVREFSINSKDDLQQFLISDPTLARRYMDVGLDYLPSSSAAALASVMPVFSGAAKRRLRVALMSELDPVTLRSANVVYVGLLSGLGMLQDVAFSASRFRIGDSYDELVDTKLDHRYVSQASPYSAHLVGEASYHDYGYFSTFAGAGGNQIVIIAGTQDEGLRQTAELFTDQTKLEQLEKQLASRTDFEAFMEVTAIDRVNLSGKILTVAPLNGTKIWNSR